MRLEVGYVVTQVVIVELGIDYEFFDFEINIIFFFRIIFS